MLTPGSHGHPHFYYHVIIVGSSYLDGHKFNRNFDACGDTFCCCSQLTLLGTLEFISNFFLFTHYFYNSIKMTLLDDPSSVHKKLSIKLSNKNSTKVFLYRSYYTPVCEQLLLTTFFNKDEIIQSKISKSFSRLLFLCSNIFSYVLTIYLL